jgi:hypothetical protein
MVAINPPPSAPHSTAPDALRTLATSWRRSVAARRVSPATIATYIFSPGRHGTATRAL